MLIEEDTEVSISWVRLKRLCKGNLTLYGLILFFILAFAVVLLPKAGIEANSSPEAKMTLAKTVDFSTPKPGDKINFTITYSNPMSQTAYNVTIFEWMPTGLTFVSSKPFYDGASTPETGFFRWSRGAVLPGGAGNVIVKAMVENVPVGTVITNTAHLSYEFENGTRVEITSSVDITVTQAAGVEVYPDQIHSVPPSSWYEEQFNLTVTNTGNGLDTFDISLRSVAFNPSGSTHEWKIELYNSTGYPTDPVATVYDESQNDPNSWIDHGVVTSVTLESGESAWFILWVTEAPGTSGNTEAYLDVHLIATSRFDPSVSDLVDKLTVVKKKAGITFAPDYTKYANPGETVVFRHIIVNSGPTEVIDLNYTSVRGWSYSFWFDNGTSLRDTDGSGYVDVGVLPNENHVYILVKVTVPYGTAAGLNDTAVITARGVISGNSDTAKDITIVKSAPILSVEKKLVSGSPSYVGDSVTYRINITNLGNTKVTKIPLDDAFETLSLDFSSADPAEDSYDEVAGTIHWENVTVLEPRQSLLVTVNFLATAADDVVRESASVIDAEDEFGNWISATYLNTELRVIGIYTLTVTASPTEALGGSFSVSWIDHGVAKSDTFTTPKEISCDQDTTAEVSSPESPITKVDVRYIFTHYSPSAMVTMDSDKTITLNYRTEYKLTFQQTGSQELVYITVNGTELTETLPQSFWVWKGSTTTFSYPSPVTDTAATRYVLTGVSGNTTNTSVTVNAPTVVIGSYKTQHYLTVNNGGHGTPAGEGWYDSGVLATFSIDPTTVPEGVGTRYVFTQWSGDSTSANPSDTVLMDGPKTVTANWKTQYKVTFQQTGSGAIVYVTYTADTDPTVAVPFSIWVKVGSTLTFSYDAMINDGQPTRYVLVSVDQTSPLTVNEPITITATYKTQHFLTVGHLPADPILNGHQTGQGYYDADYTATVTADQHVDIVAGESRYTFDYWSGDASGTSTTTTVVMSAPKTATANYKTQYYITVTSDHDIPTPSAWVDAGSDFNASVTSPADDDGMGTRYRCTGYRIDEGELEEGASYTFVNVQAAHTIEFEWIAQHYLTVKITPSDVPTTISGEGWYDENTLVGLTAPLLASVSDGVRYRFDQWTVDSTTSSSNSITVTMDAPKTATAQYVKQFKLTVVSTHDSPEPPSGDHWYDEGESITASVSSPADQSDGTRYRCTGWAGTGSVPETGTDTSLAFVITAPSSIEWKWIAQHQLTILNGGHGVATPASGGWYDEGTWVTITMGSDTVSNSTGTRYLFASWSGSGLGSYSESANPCQVQMNSPITETASWKTQHYLTVSSAHGTTGGAGWYDSGSTAYATLDTDIVSGESGVRYVFTQWSGDAAGSSYAKSEPVAMNAPKTATANWKTQYYLTVTTNPEGLDDPTGEGWYDEGTDAEIGVDTPTGGDGVSTRYRFLNWAGTGIADVTATSTTILMDSPKEAKAVFIQQFYLTMATNFGTVTPDSGWYDEGAVVAIRATAPEIVQGKGYVWHGWTGTGEVSYSGLINPAIVTMNSAISETAHWKIDPIVTITISDDTVASGDRIVVYGIALPVQSSVRVLVTYVFPNGTQIEHVVYTDDMGYFEDTLLLRQGYLYSLFKDAGEWVITANRQGDVSHETAEASTRLTVEAPSVVQVHPALIAALIVAAALVAYVLIVKKVKNNNSLWWRATVILCCTGLIFGLVSLALNWVFVTGAVTIEDVTYHVGVLLYPFSNGLVSITEGIRYIGTVMPSMIDPTWQNVLGSTGPVLTLWLVPVGCSLLLFAAIYKPKNERQRNLKMAILVISGVLIVASAVQGLIFVAGQVGTLAGAGIGYGAGVYLAIISGTLTLLSGLFAYREYLVKPTKAEEAESAESAEKIEKPPVK